MDRPVKQIPDLAINTLVSGDGAQITEHVTHHHEAEVSLGIGRYAVLVALVLQLHPAGREAAAQALRELLFNGHDVLLSACDYTEGMDATDSERYDVYFRGECLDGTDEASVRSALGRLFRADEQTLARLFSGELQRIKRDVDRPTAEKYRKAMEAAGARPLISATKASADPASGPAPAPSAARATPAAADRGFEVAPVGSDVLRPEERPRHDGTAPATDHLDLAPLGESLGMEHVAAAPVSAPHFDVAEVGSDLAAPTNRHTAAAPDTSGITLAAPDHDLSDCTPPVPDAPPPDIAHLSAAPPGSELISENEREKPQAVAPSTEHLSLAEAPAESEASKDGGTGILDRQ